MPLLLAVLVERSTNAILIIAEDVHWPTYDSGSEQIIFQNNKTRIVKDDERVEPMRFQIQLALGQVRFLFTSAVTWPVLIGDRCRLEVCRLENNLR